MDMKQERDWLNQTEENLNKIFPDEPVFDFEKDLKAIINPSNTKKKVTKK